MQLGRSTCTLAGLPHIELSTDQQFTIVDYDSSTKSKDWEDGSDSQLSHLRPPEQT